jgi:hypothetical protein
MRVYELLNELKDCQQDAQLIIAVPDAHAGHVLEFEAVAKEEKEPMVILFAHSTTKNYRLSKRFCARNEIIVHSRLYHAISVLSKLGFERRR